MRAKRFAIAVTATACLAPIQVSAQNPPSGKAAPTICQGGIVDKQRFFSQLADNATPRPSSQLLTSVNWRTLATNPDICKQSKDCAPNDPDALKNIQDEYQQFVDFPSKYYSISNPGLTASQYFQGANNVNPIRCVGNATPPPAPTSPLDAKSQFRIRGVSDDLWISQSDPNGTFAKASSATVNFLDNDTVPHTSTTNITAAIGYDLLPDGNLQSLVPYVSGNVSLIDTQRKPRVIAPSNFVAAGILYDTSNYVSDPFPRADHLTLKAQQVDGTTMRSELTSLQAIYAPWTNPNAPLPALNSVEPLDVSLPYFGALLFDVRADLGYYEDRGDPQYVAQNKSFARFGTRVGYSFIANPSSVPGFNINVTETALYGANGGPRNLSYFDALLQIYFDQKKYFSSNVEYINGRDENTYAITHQYKAGFSAHY